MPNIVVYSVCAVYLELPSAQSIVNMSLPVSIVPRSLQHMSTVYIALFPVLHYSYHHLLYREGGEDRVKIIM